MLYIKKVILSNGQTITLPRVRKLIDKYGNEDHNRILGIIQNRKEISKNVLTQYTRFVTTARRDAIVAQLVQDGKITCYHGMSGKLVYVFLPKIL